ncbi:unnamed protein product [Larinioides sclopetarius]|uniref:Argonaute linker 1 domain-containing protein n=1 Tax=Larinioides sclopetarius TaxID=280406 RepID=A0AAV2BX45_9ARAC
MDTLHALYASKVTSVPQETVMALETILRDGPCKSFIPIKHSFYFPPAPPLGGGLDIWFGYEQSLRLAHWKPSINIDMTATAFYHAGPVLRYIAETLKLDPARLRQAGCLKDHDIIKISKELKREPVVFDGRILEGEFYGGDRSIQPRNGSWDMRGNQYFRGAKIDSWILLSFSKTNLCSYEDLEKFVKLLYHEASEKDDELHSDTDISSNYLDYSSDDSCSEISSDEDLSSARIFTEVEVKHPPISCPLFKFTGTPSVHIQFDDTSDVLQFYETFIDSSLMSKIVQIT